MSIDKYALLFDYREFMEMISVGDTLPLFEELNEGREATKALNRVLAMIDKARQDGKSSIGIDTLEGALDTLEIQVIQEVTPR